MIKLNILRDEKGTVSVIGFIFVIFTIVSIIAYIITVVGFASTVVSFLPQPSISTLTTALLIIIVLKGISLIIYGILTLAATVASPAIGLLSLGVLLFIIVPILYLVYLAGMTVWVELPDTYEVQAAFIFLISTLLVYLNYGSDDD